MAFTPTDPTKAEVRVVGTAPNQQLDFYIPRGAKGEPGGIVMGTDLGTTNLNDIKVPGVYRQPNTGNATALNNYPKTLRGGMVVWARDGAVVMQEYTVIDGASAAHTTYRRLFDGVSTWTAWKSHAHTRVDQTAGRAIYQWDDLNNREQLVYGDTGERDINASHGNGTFAALKLRRFGSTVDLVCVGWLPPTNGAGAFTAALPVGFRSTHTRTFTAVDAGTVRPAIMSSGSANITVTGSTTASNIGFTLTYVTTDTWPTTLPGTAVGSIPNL